MPSLNVMKFTTACKKTEVFGPLHFAHYTTDLFFHHFYTVVTQLLASLLTCLVVHLELHCCHYDITTADWMISNGLCCAVA